MYDIAANRGFVSVGTGSDTAAFAVNALRLWWRQWLTRHLFGTSVFAIRIFPALCGVALVWLVPDRRIESIM